MYIEEYECQSIYTAVLILVAFRMEAHYHYLSTIRFSTGSKVLTTQSRSD